MDLAAHIIFDFTFNIEIGLKIFTLMTGQKVDIFQMRSLNLIHCEQ